MSKPFVYAIAIGAVVVLVLSGVSSAMAQCRPLKSTPWKIEQAAVALHTAAESGVDPTQLEIAIRNKESVLLWTGQDVVIKPGDLFNKTEDLTKIAWKANLLIEAPFEKIQPAIAQMLTGFGKFVSHNEQISINDAPDDDWEDVRLSRGLSPLGGQLTYASYFAKQDQSYGITKRWHSFLKIQVFDASWMFRHPATGVIISRSDVVPNSAFHFGDHFDISPFNPATKSRQSGGSVVPGTLFEAIRTAMTAAGQSAELYVAYSPKIWEQSDMNCK